jgi:hypothetical protein
MAPLLASYVPSFKAQNPQPRDTLELSTTRFCAERTEVIVNTVTSTSNISVRKRGCLGLDPGHRPAGG